MKRYLVFDIGGTDIKYGVLDKNLTFFVKDSFPSKGPKGGIYVLNDIIEVAKPLIKEHDIKGIGLSSAGVINSDTGLVLSATNSIRNYTGINIITYLENELNIKVTVENDVNCMALCESKYGAGKDFNNISALTVGTGIGGSVIVDKHVLKGSSFSAGEFGLMIINGVTYEETASMSALVKNAQSKIDTNIKDGIEVFNLYDKGYYQAKILVNNFYQALAIGIVNIIYVTNPNIVVIGGGITNRSTFLEELLPFIKQYLRQWEKKNTIITTAKYKNDAGMIGAMVHHLEKFN